jgi:hypothetical protein
MDMKEMHSSDTNIKTKVALKAAWNITIMNESLMHILLQEIALQSS